jgi:hypothetical protein
MDIIERDPIRCLAGRWQVLHGDEWLTVSSYDQAELLAWSEHVCYSVINKQVEGSPVATYLDSAAQAWLEYYHGHPTRMYRLCSALADRLRDQIAAKAF